MSLRILWIGFLLRLGVAFWNAFFGPSFGADGDAIGLHIMALDFMDGHWPATMRVIYLYPYFLAAFYGATVPSLFVGGVLSSLAWLVSAYALLASLQLIGATRRSQSIAMLIFTCLPSSVLWTSVTLREPYQLLCVTLATYAGLKVGIERRYRYFLLLGAAVAAGAILHGALLGWGVVFVAGIGSWVLTKRATFSPLRMVVAAAVTVVVVVAGYRVFTTFYSFPVDRGLAFAVESYQRGGLGRGVRTDYRSTVAIADTSDLALFIPVALAQYLFEPMPWRITSFIDLVSIQENLIRAGLIVQAVLGLLLFRGRPKHATVVVLSSYLVLETAWALGTFNWGTAARHQIPGLGLLLLAAFGAQGQSVGVGEGAADGSPAAPGSAS